MWFAVLAPFWALFLCYLLFRFVRWTYPDGRECFYALHQPKYDMIPHGPRLKSFAPFDFSRIGSQSGPAAMPSIALTKFRSA